jgi:hypothetical protein
MMFAHTWKILGLLALGYIAAPSSANASSFYAVGQGGLCVDVARGTAKAGTPVILWHCHGKAPQLFTIDVARSKIRYKAAPQLCIDDIAGKGLALADCNKTRFAWNYNTRSQRIEGSDGRCWDVANADYTAGKRLIIWRCHGGKNQRFVFRIP